MGRETFESEGLKVNLNKTKAIVSGPKEEILKSQVDPFAKCPKRVMGNSVLYIKYGILAHDR